MPLQIFFLKNDTLPTSGLFVCEMVSSSLLLGNLYDSTLLNKVFGKIFSVKHQWQSPLCQRLVDYKRLKQAMPNYHSLLYHEGQLFGGVVALPYRFLWRRYSLDNYNQKVTEDEYITCYRNAVIAAIQNAKTLGVPLYITPLAIMNQELDWNVERAGKRAGSLFAEAITKADPHNEVSIHILLNDKNDIKERDDLGSIILLMGYCTSFVDTLYTELPERIEKRRAPIASSNYSSLAYNSSPASPLPQHQTGPTIKSYISYVSRGVEAFNKGNLPLDGSSNSNSTSNLPISLPQENKQIVPKVTFLDDTHDVASLASSDRRILIVEEISANTCALHPNTTKTTSLCMYAQASVSYSQRLKFAYRKVIKNAIELAQKEKSTLYIPVLGLKREKGEEGERESWDPAIAAACFYEEIIAAALSIEIIILLSSHPDAQTFKTTLEASLSNRAEEGSAMDHAASLLPSHASIPSYLIPKPEPAHDQNTIEPSLPLDSFMYSFLTDPIIGTILIILFVVSVAALIAGTYGLATPAAVVAGNVALGLTISGVLGIPITASLLGYSLFKQKSGSSDEENNMNNPAFNAT